MPVEVLKGRAEAPAKGGKGGLPERINWWKARLSTAGFLHPGN